MTAYSFAFVGDGAAISANEQTIVDTLTAAGHTYVRYGQDTGARNVTGIDALILGPEGGSAGFANWVTDANTSSVPILCMFHSAWDDVGLQLGASGTSTTALTTTDLLTHPIITISGLTPSSNVTLFTSSATARVVSTGGGNLGTGNVAIVGYTNTGTSSCVMVALASGEVPASGVGTVPARRVAFGPSSASWNTLSNANADLLLDAALRWTAGENAGGIAYSGAGTTTVTFAAAGVGTLDKSGEGAFSVGFAATGSAQLDASSVGTLAVGFIGAGVGQVELTGAGTLPVGFAASGVATLGSQAAGSLTVTMGISGVGATAKTGAGTLVASFGATGVGALDGSGGGVLAVGFDATGVGAVQRFGSGSLSIGVSPGGAGVIGYTTSGTLLIVASFTGAVPPPDLQDICLVSEPLAPAWDVSRLAYPWVVAALTVQWGVSKLSFPWSVVPLADRFESTPEGC